MLRRWGHVGASTDAASSLAASSASSGVQGRRAAAGRRRAATAGRSRATVAGVTGEVVAAGDGLVAAAGDVAGVTGEVVAADAPVAVLKRPAAAATRKQSRRPSKRNAEKAVEAVAAPSEEAVVVVATPPEAALLVVATPPETDTEPDENAVQNALIRYGFDANQDCLGLGLHRERHEADLREAEAMSNLEAGADEAVAGPQHGGEPRLDVEAEAEDKEEEEDAETNEEEVQHKPSAWQDVWDAVADSGESAEEEPHQDYERLIDGEEEACMVGNSVFVCFVRFVCFNCSFTFCVFLVFAFLVLYFSYFSSSGARPLRIP